MIPFQGYMFAQAGCASDFIMRTEDSVLPMTLTALDFFTTFHYEFVVGLGEGG